MKIIVCGGRNFQGKDCVYRTLNEFHAKNRVTSLIEGGANGVDNLAALWAQDHSQTIKHVTINADWTLYGKRAGPLRNQRMIDQERPDAVIAFPGGAGTADLVRRAQCVGIKVYLVDENGETNVG